MLHHKIVAFAQRGRNSDTIRAGGHGACVVRTVLIIMVDVEGDAADGTAIKPVCLFQVDVAGHRLVLDLKGVGFPILIGIDFRGVASEQETFRRSGFFDAVTAPFQPAGFDDAVHIGYDGDASD